MAPSVEEVEEGGRVGWWGPPTSSIDWCEDNYQVSSMHIWSGAIHTILFVLWFVLCCK